MHAEPCTAAVVVHQSGVGQIVDLSSVGGGDGGAADVAQPLGEREDLVSIDVVGGAAVAIGLPVPAQTDGLNRHAVTAGQSR